VTRESETGKASVGKAAFNIPEMSHTTIKMTSPLLFSRGSESKFFKFSKKKDSRKEKELSLGDIYKYLPKNHHLVVGEISPKTRNLLAVLPVTYTAGPSSEIEFSIFLHPKPDGDAFVLPMQINQVRSISGNKDILMIKIQLPDCGPGDYELEIEAKEKNTSSRFSVRRSLMVK
jgi:hypothetical protein